VKILLIQPIGHRPSGLIPDIVLYSNALAALGADVTLLTFDGILVKPDEIVEQSSYCSRHKVIARPLCLLEKILGHLPLLDFTIWMDTLLTLSLVPKLVKRNGYDAIHILESHPKFLPLIFLGLAIKNHPILLTVRTSIRYSQCELNQKLKEALKSRDFKQFRGLVAQSISNSRLKNAIMKFLFQKAEKRNQIVFTCESPHTEEAYKETLFNGRFACIPIGIAETFEILPRSAARTQLKLPDNGPVFLSFGVNHRQKNYETIFQAISHLPKNFTFLYAGKIDHSANDPEKLARDYGWADRSVIVDGFISQEDTKYYFSAANAIILSYSREFLHGSGVLSFATGYNLPVIASDVGQLGKIVRTRGLGLTFVPEDPDSLREAIVEFLKLPESEYNQIRQNLKAFATSYTWGDVARKHLELYRSLADTTEGLILHAAEGGGG
jgi:glycosyltransferase involved in cell wall biosynthesis